MENCLIQVWNAKTNFQPEGEKPISGIFIADNDGSFTDIKEMPKLAQLVWLNQLVQELLGEMRRMQDTTKRVEVEEGNPSEVE